MTRLMIAENGQVTLRRDLLKHLGVVPGQKVEVDKLPDGKIAVRAARKKRTTADFIGCLAQKNSPTLTIDEINKISAQGWIREK